MSVVRVELVAEGRGGSDSWNGTKWVRTYVQQFLAFTDDPLDTKAIVLLSPMLPRRFAPFHQDPFALAEKRDAQQHQGFPLVWEVTIDYTSDVNASDDQEEQAQDPNDPNPFNTLGDPLIQPVLVDFTTRSRPISLMVDYGPLGDGNDPVPICNSIGEPFPPADDEEEYDLVITITRNVATFPATTAWAAIGSCNRTPWTVPTKNLVFAFYTCRIVAWDGGDQLESNNIRYYRQRVEVQVRYPDWVKRILNEGTTSFEDDGQYSNLKAAVSEKGLPINKRVRLDAQGIELAADAADVFKEFHTKRTADFNLLPI